MQACAKYLRFHKSPIPLTASSLRLAEVVQGLLSRIWLVGREQVLKQLGGVPNDLAVGPHSWSCVRDKFGFALRDPDKTLLPQGGADHQRTRSIQTVDRQTCEVLKSSGRDST